MVKLEHLFYIEKKYHKVTPTPTTKHQQNKKHHLSSILQFNSQNEIKNIISVQSSSLIPKIKRQKFSPQIFCSTIGSYNSCFNVL